MKQKLIPIASVIVGIIAFLLAHQYLRSKIADLERERQRLYAGAKKTTVMVATKDLSRGTSLNQTDLTTKEVPASAITERYVTFGPDARLLLGKKTVRALKAQEPIMWDDIEGGAPPVQGLSSMIQHSLRAVSVAVSGPAGVSGMIEPNDHVDVLGTFSFPSKTSSGDMETVTLTVLQDVTILAVGQTTAKLEQMRARAQQKSAGYSTVTLEVTPREAELLIFAQQLQGRLSLVLRNPTDVSFEANLPEVNFKYLEGKLPELNQFRQKQIRHKPGM